MGTRKWISNWLIIFFMNSFYTFRVWIHILSHFFTLKIYFCVTSVLKYTPTRFLIYLKIFQQFGTQFPCDVLNILIYLISSTYSLQIWKFRLKEHIFWSIKKKERNYKVLEHDLMWLQLLIRESTLNICQLSRQLGLPACLAAWLAGTSINYEAICPQIC